MVKLKDLEPRYFGLDDTGRTVGLTFLCPHCLKERLGVFFHERGQEAVQDSYIKAHSPGTNHIWTKTGMSFDNLTLEPSIDASATGHWHGFILNGEIK